MHPPLRIVRREIPRRRGCGSFFSSRTRLGFGPIPAKGWMEGAPSTFQTGVLPYRMEHTLHRCKKSPPVTVLRDHRSYHRNFAGQKRETIPVAGGIFGCQAVNRVRARSTNANIIIFRDFVNTFPQKTGETRRIFNFLPVSSVLLPFPVGSLSCQQQPQHRRRPDDLGHRPLELHQ